MEPVKISFGFNKTTKRTNIIPIQAKPEAKKVELVECLEGQSIKVKDAVEEVKQPLVIPLKDDQRNLLDRVRAAKKREEPKNNDEEEEDTRPDSELSVDELAAKQLIKEAKARLTNGHSINNTKISVLPLKQDAHSLEGEKEPTLDDYESVPINDYGLAILRGMGWKEGMPIGKNASKTIAVSVPELRPKGLGLGATKVVQSEMPLKKAVDKDGKELILVKGAFAKVIAGPHKGHYCEVQGFDEEAGRVIVKVHPAGDIVNINELMLTPVTKEEFSKGSKILNNAKYEEYKEISDKKLDDYKIKQESSLSRKVKREKNSSDSDGERNHRKDEEKNHSPESLRREESLKIRRSDDRSPSCSSSKTKSYKRHDTQSSDSDYQLKDKIRSSVKQKSKNRRSQSRSRYSSHKKDDTKHQNPPSSDEDYKDKARKSSKHSKSKNRDRSRSKSGSRHRKHKKHSSSRHNRDSSESDSGKKERRKKNKCKSRHRRNNSSSSEDRQYKNKK